MSSGHSRRAFLARSSFAVAGGLLGRAVHAAPRWRNAQEILVPARSTRAVASFAPPLADPATMRAMARTAIEAATQAGAQYADIRIGDVREYRSSTTNPQTLSFMYGFGLRVQVDGGTAFVGGVEPTPERVVQAARSAVATARGLAKIGGPAASRLPAPVATGEWTAPIQIDPFSVSPDDHMFVLSGLARVKSSLQPYGMDSVSVRWTAETRVFASSEGALVTQHLAHAVPDSAINIFARGTAEPRMLRGIPAFRPCTAGFEVLLGTALHEQLDAMLQEFLPWSTYPTSEVEVGRKEIVLAGRAFGSLIGGLLPPILTLDRALGNEQDAGGTSIFAPTDAMLGQPLFSSHLNLSVDTGEATYGRMQWDDEGVTPRSFPLIEKGALVDYLATRTNAQPLSAWHMGRGQPLTPQGSTWAEDVIGPPRSAPRAFAVTPAQGGPSLAELIQSMTDGLVFWDTWVNVDQQGAGGWITPWVAFEVKKGVITRRPRAARLEFSTKRLLKEIRVGGPNTVEAVYNERYSGIPWTLIGHAMSAPAAYLKEANLVAPELRIV